MLVRWLGGSGKDWRDEKASSVVLHRVELLLMFRITQECQLACLCVVIKCEFQCCCCCCIIVENPASFLSLFSLFFSFFSLSLSIVFFFLFLFAVMVFVYSECSSFVCLCFRVLNCLHLSSCRCVSTSSLCFVSLSSDFSFIQYLFFFPCLLL